MLVLLKAKKPVGVLLLSTFGLLLLALTATSAWAGSVSVHGIVADAHGQGLSGAVVEIFPARTGHEVAVDLLDGVEREPLARTTTDADGSYRLRGAPGLYEVRASARGRAPRTLFPFPITEDRALPTAQLYPRLHLAIRVLDASGGPAEGAQVWFRAGGQIVGPERWLDLPQRRTVGSDGTVEVGHSGRGPMDVVVTMPDGLVFSRENFRAEGEFEIQFESIWIEGPLLLSELEFFNPHGDPGADHVVYLARSGLPLGRLDESGRLRMVTRRPQTVDVRISTGDGLRADTEVGSGGDQRVTIREPQALEGVVLDADSGLPIPGARVWAGSYDGHAALTGADGGFSVTTDSATPRLLVRAGGYLKATLYFSKNPTINPRAITIPLRAAGGLVGRVVDGEGRGLGDVRIEVIRQNTGPPIPPVLQADGFRESVQSSGDGTFEFADLVAGGTYNLSAHSEGVATAMARVEIPPVGGGPGSVTVTLEAAAGLCGRIVDGAGRPVEGADVRLDPPRELDQRRASRPQWRPRWGAALAEAVSGPDGRFRLAAVGAGTYRLRVRKPGFAETDLKKLEAHETSSGCADAGSIPIFPGGPIEGRVVDERTRPLSDVEVTCSEMSGTHRERRKTTTDARGRFRCEDLRNGETLDVKALHPGYLMAEVRGVAVPTAEPVQLVLSPESVLRGRVLDAAGSPLVDALVVAAEDRGVPLTLSERFDHLSTARTDEAGRFALHQVPPGYVRLFLRASEWELAKQPTFEVGKAEQIREIELRARRGDQLSGQIRDAEGRPVVGARVSILDLEGNYRGSAWVQSDGAGSWAVSGLGAGAYRVEVRHPDHGEARRRIEISGGAPKTVNLRLDGQFSVSGRVITADGTPAEGARVELQGIDRLDSWPNRTVFADSGGRFHMSHLQGGSFRIRALYPSHAQLEMEPIELRDASVSGLVLKLSGGTTVVGRLLGVEPADLPSTKVYATRPGTVSSGTVRPDGTFRIEALGSGHWLLHAESEGINRHMPIQVPADTNQASFDLDFIGGFALAGSLRLDGEAFPGGTLTLRSATHGSHTARTDVRGQFRFESVPAGTYTLSAGVGDPNLNRYLTVEIPRAEALVIEVDSR